MTIGQCKDFIAKVEKWRKHKIDKKLEKLEKNLTSAQLTLGIKSMPIIPNFRSSGIRILKAHG